MKQTCLYEAPFGNITLIIESDDLIELKCGLNVLIEGNAIDFKSGGSGEGAEYLRAMAKSAISFVRA